jgi:hypothetical protein
MPPTAHSIEQPAYASTPMTRVGIPESTAARGERNAVIVAEAIYKPFALFNSRCLGLSSGLQDAVLDKP